MSRDMIRLPFFLVVLGFKVGIPAVICQLGGILNQGFRIDIRLLARQFLQCVRDEPSEAWIRVVVDVVCDQLVNGSVFHTNSIRYSFVYVKQLYYINKYLTADRIHDQDPCRNNIIKIACNVLCYALYYSHERNAKSHSL